MLKDPPRIKDNSVARSQQGNLCFVFIFDEQFSTYCECFYIVATFVFILCVYVSVAFTVDLLFVLGIFHYIYIIY